VCREGKAGCEPRASTAQAGSSPKIHSGARVVGAMGSVGCPVIIGHSEAVSWAGICVGACSEAAGDKATCKG